MNADIYLICLVFILIVLVVLVTRQLFVLFYLEYQYFRGRKKVYNFDISVSEYLFFVRILILKKMWFRAIYALESSDNLERLNRHYCYNALGCIYQSISEYDLAKFYYTQALSVKSNYLAALRNLFSLYLKIDDKRSAQIISKKIMSINSM